MDRYHEQQRRSDRPIHAFLKERVGNSCHVLAELLALEAGNLTPRHLKMAREELNRIMGTVEQTSDMVQPDDGGWTLGSVEGESGERWN